MRKSDGHKGEKTMAPEAAAPQDVVIVHGVTEDRKGLRVLRARDERIEAGEVRPLKEGQPITSDVVKLHPRKGAPFLCDVETTYSSTESTSSNRESTSPSEKSLSARSGRTTSAGPAQVASPAYRDNWDAIWAKRPLDKGSSGLN